MKTHAPLVFAALLAVACGGPEADPTSDDGGGISVPDAGGTLPLGGSPDAGSGASGPLGLTVDGQVIGTDGLAPDHVISVVITGKSPVAVTDGHFSVPDVTAPYDLTIIDGTANSAIVYQGLTRANPVVLAATTSRARTSVASLSGRISGGTYPQGTNQYTAVVLDRAGGGQTAWTDASGNYSISGFRWGGDTSFTGRVYALQVETNSALLPARYLGFASTTASIASGGTFSGMNLGLAPVTSSSVSGVVHAPSGYTPAGRKLWILFGESGIEFKDASTSDGFSYVTPNAPQGFAAVVAFAGKPSAAAVHYEPFNGFSASGAALNLVAAPEAVLPTDGATAVDGQTQFSWTPFAGGVHAVAFMPVNGTGPVIQIITTATSAHLPDLSAYGMTLPSGTKYEWHAEGLGPAASMDAAAQPSFRAQWNFTSTSGIDWGTATSRTFTAR